FKPRVFQCHHRRGVGELRVTRHPLRLQFGFDIVMGIETFHFARNAAFQIARVKKCDRTDTAATGEDRSPELLVANSVRCQNSHSGDNNAISVHSFSRPRVDKPLVKTARAIPAAKSEGLAVKGLSIFFGTNESPGILNATLSPVIIFFPPKS